MTELIYEINGTYTTNYAIACALRDQTHAPLKRIYRPVAEYTQAQKDDFKAHAEKAAAYRKKHKNS